MNFPPGVVALIYKQCWDIEKVFDELKSKLDERKSWGSGATSKTCHKEFMCLADCLMILLAAQEGLMFLLSFFGASCL